MTGSVIAALCALPAPSAMGFLDDFGASGLLWARWACAPRDPEVRPSLLRQPQQINTRPSPRQPLSLWLGQRALPALHALFIGIVCAPGRRSFLPWSGLQVAPLGSDLPWACLPGLHRPPHPPVEMSRLLGLLLPLSPRISIHASGLCFPLLEL